MPSLRVIVLNLARPSALTFNPSPFLPLTFVAPGVSSFSSLSLTVSFELSTVDLLSAISFRTYAICVRNFFRMNSFNIRELKLL
jgi:hypothetical protein